MVPGVYTLIETKAPEGYLLNKSEVPFKVADEAVGKPETISLSDFINYQGSVQLKKVSEQGKTLSGAIFGLYHANGKQVGEYTSDREGHVSVNNLSPGEYYFMEIGVPTGYSISKEKRTFTISSAEKNKPATVDAGEFVNKESSKTPDSSESPDKPNGSNHTSGTTTGSYPKTNDTHNPWLLIAGALIIIIVGIVYYRRRKG